MYLHEHKHTLSPTSQLNLLYKIMVSKSLGQLDFAVKVIKMYKL